MTKEEAIKILQNIVKHNEDEDAAIFMAIRALRDTSFLPSDLDEAAKKIVIQLHPSMEFSTVLGERLTMGELVELIKAGAEWMARQGVTKEAVIGMATEEISINVSEQTLDELNLFPGDKVVVQIRKK